MTVPSAPTPSASDAFEAGRRLSRDRLAAKLAVTTLFDAPPRPVVDVPLPEQAS